MEGVRAIGSRWRLAGGLTELLRKQGGPESANTGPRHAQPNPCPLLRGRTTGLRNCPCPHWVLGHDSPKCSSQKHAAIPQMFQVKL